ncbi:hypothetical protein BLNAU_1591 [Blattamonas nauphoetae]|uniref:Uncharacterized protein n=1 Tax=Blattamonas nauphoetae TaxID=2049346 RepID=A0ABQ9YIJ5_9EUKA|nr:hypothetical protein BLNAU_1591 [Blattamonas nauphoetae]
MHLSEILKRSTNETGELDSSFFNASLSALSENSLPTSDDDSLACGTFCSVLETLISTSASVSPIDPIVATLKNLLLISEPFRQSFTQSQLPTLFLDYNPHDRHHLQHKTYFKCLLILLLSPSTSTRIISEITPQLFKRLADITSFTDDQPFLNFILHCTLSFPPSSSSQLLSSLREKTRTKSAMLSQIQRCPVRPTTAAEIMEPEVLFPKALTHLLEERFSSFQTSAEEWMKCSIDDEIDMSVIELGNWIGTVMLFRFTLLLDQSANTTMAMECSMIPFSLQTITSIHTLIDQKDSIQKRGARLLETFVSILGRSWDTLAQLMHISHTQTMEAIHSIIGENTGIVALCIRSIKVCSTNIWDTTLTFLANFTFRDDSMKGCLLRAHFPSLLMQIIQPWDLYSNDHLVHLRLVWILVHLLDKPTEEGCDSIEEKKQLLLNEVIVPCARYFAFIFHIEEHIVLPSHRVHDFTVKLSWLERFIIDFERENPNLDVGSSRWRVERLFEMHDVQKLVSYVEHLTRIDPQTSIASRQGIARRDREMVALGSEDAFESRIFVKYPIYSPGERFKDFVELRGINP